MCLNDVDILLNKEVLEIFDKLASSLPKDSKVLDIGCGAGFFLYRIYHKHNIQNLHGIDKSEKIKSMETSILSSAPFTTNLLFNYIKHTTNHYDLYCEYVENDLIQIPLNESNYNAVFIIDFETLFEDYKPKDFDLIIASRVLHYLSVEEQKSFVQKCINSLSPNGIIFITFPTYSGQTKISRAEFEDIICQYFKLATIQITEIKDTVPCIDDEEGTAYGSFIIFAGRKVA